MSVPDRPGSQLRLGCFRVVGLWGCLAGEVASVAVAPSLAPDQHCSEGDGACGAGGGYLGRMLAWPGRPGPLRQLGGGLRD